MEKLGPSTDNVDEGCKEGPTGYGIEAEFWRKVGLFRQKIERIQRSHAEGTLGKIM